MAYHIYSGMVSSGLTLNNDSMYISSGGLAENTIMQNAYMYVSNGGAANHTIAAAAEIYVYSGGTVNNTWLENFGIMEVDGGVANDTNLLGGNFMAYMYVIDNGIATRTTVSKGGILGVQNGTINDTVVSSGGSAAVLAGAANKTTVHSGGIFVISNCTAKDTRVYSGGIAALDAGANVTSFVADAGAALILTVAPDTHIKGTSAGVAFEMKDAVLSNFTVNGGGLLISSGGTAKNTNVVSAVASVYSGGVMQNTRLYQGGEMHIENGTTINTVVSSGGGIVLAGGNALNTAVYSGGVLYLAPTAKHFGILRIEKGAVVSAYQQSNIDFTIIGREVSDGYLLNDFSLIQGNPNFSISVAPDQKNGTYRLADNVGNAGGTIYIGDDSVYFGRITVNGNDLVYQGKTYSLDNINGHLTLTVKGGKNPTVDGDIDGNGYADTVLVHTKQGYSGAWMTTGTSSVIKWGDLGNVNSKVELIGTGNVNGTKEDGSDIFMKIGTTIAAWETEGGKVKNYKELYTLKSNMNMLGIGDFDGDGVTDYLLRSNSGDLGFVTGDDNAWHYVKGLGKEWKIAAVGDLNDDGIDDIIVRHDAGFTGAYMLAADGKIQWSNLDTLKSDMTIVGTGDFNSDGVDDVLLQNKSNGWVGAWLVEDGRVDSFMGICNNKNSIEQIADFNFDGTDDIRIRTADGDIGVLYVKGADTTEWKYFQSVGKEWDTSFALLS